ncbi:MAG: hypothetical protein M0Z75_16095 [Nitrospiraceae bacterium]|nr:hypothetical protein [Nitrospiraceae bacterium]
MKEIRKLIRPICNESGLTLVIVMVLSVVALLMMSALIYMVQSGTEISGMQKRFTTAVDAGMGGVDVTRQFIDTQGSPPNLGAINFKLTTEGSNCSTIKLTKPTSAWGVCNSSVVLNPADSPNSANASYDMTATLGQYTVYAKIVDTVPGNTAQGAGLVQTGVVASNSGQTPVQAVPYLYTLEVLSQGTDQSLRERSKLTAVYQY